MCRPGFNDVNVSNRTAMCMCVCKSERVLLTVAMCARVCSGAGVGVFVRPQPGLTLGRESVRVGLYLCESYHRPSPCSAPGKRVCVSECAYVFVSLELSVFVCLCVFLYCACVYVRLCVWKGGGCICVTRFDRCPRVFIS